MDESSLRTAVEAAFVHTAAATPGWPDPHPEGGRPAKEEFSRRLQSGKYSILAARAQAWTNALIESGLATTAEPFEPTDAPVSRWGLPPGSYPTRAYWLRPQRTGALPLLISFRGFDGCDDNIVAVSAGEPPIMLLNVPECGCDACDDGSDSLLKLLDRAVVDVITDQFVYVSTPHGDVTGHGGGWEARGFDGPTDIQKILDDARAGRSPHRVVRGKRWW